jgi:hypothetical protein
MPDFVRILRREIEIITLNPNATDTNTSAKNDAGSLGKPSGRNFMPAYQ